MIKSIPFRKKRPHKRHNLRWKLGYWKAGAMIWFAHLFGRCKICGKKRKIDCAGYCNTCYPYGIACDRYKASISQTGGKLTTYHRLRACGIDPQDKDYE